MYQYDPKPEKKREKLLVFGMLSLALLLFVVSKMPNMKYPAFFQLFAVCFLAAAVFVASRCLLRRYVYQIEPGTDENVTPDFTVTEYYGNHVTVVCRISAADVEKILPVTAQNRKEISSMIRKKRVYYYTATLWANNKYLLLVRDEDETFYMHILADSRLLSYFHSD